MQSKSITSSLLSHSQSYTLQCLMKWNRCINLILSIRPNSSSIDTGQEHDWRINLIYRYMFLMSTMYIWAPQCNMWVMGLGNIWNFMKAVPELIPKACFSQYLGLNNITISTYTFIQKNLPKASVFIFSSVKLNKCLKLAKWWFKLRGVSCILEFTTDISERTVWPRIQCHPT